MTGNCNGSKKNLLRGRWRWHRFSLKILRQLIATPEVVESADAFTRVTLPGLVQEDRVLLRDEPVLLALPLCLQVEITSQISEAVAFDKQREELGSLFLQARCGRNVEELEARELAEEWPIGSQMGDIPIQVLVFGINVREGDHRHVIRRRISNAEGKSVREGDAIAVPVGWSEQSLTHLESLDKVPALGLSRLEIIVFRMRKNEIEGQEPGLDVSEFVLPPIAEIVFADGGVELP
jgi:hypothetical protein